MLDRNPDAAFPSINDNNRLGVGQGLCSYVTPSNKLLLRKPYVCIVRKGKAFHVVPPCWCQLTGKSPQGIESLLAYLEVKSVLTILEVTRAEPSIFRCGHGVLVSGPSCAVRRI